MDRRWKRPIGGHTVEAGIYRVDTPTGKRTLLQTVEPSEKAGSTQNVRLAYAVDSKTYVYGTAGSRDVVPGGRIGIRCGVAL